LFDPACKAWSSDNFARRRYRRAAVGDEGVCHRSKFEFMIFLFSGHQELVAKTKTANPSGRRFAT